MKLRFVAVLFLLITAASAFAEPTARTVKYHANDIITVKAKLRYTTLIQLPTTEKILEVATGDKDFWIIDAVGSYCFLHPAKTDSSKAFCKPTAIQPTIKSAGREWYMPFVGLMLEDSFSRRCS
jgi:hypothetical protein